MYEMLAQLLTIDHIFNILAAQCVMLCLRRGNLFGGYRRLKKAASRSDLIRDFLQRVAV